MIPRAKVLADPSHSLRHLRAAHQRCRSERKQRAADARGAPPRRWTRVRYVRPPPRRTRECNERGYRWLSLRNPAKVASASPNPAKPFASVRVVRAVLLMALAALLAVLLASPPAVCPSPGRLRRASLPAAPAPQADGQRLEAVDPGRAPPREANLSLSVGCAANAAGDGPTARPANATLTPALVASGRDTATRLRRGGPALGTSRGCASTVPASPAPGPSRLSNSRAYLPPPSPRPRAPRDPPRDGRDRAQRPIHHPPARAHTRAQAHAQARTRTRAHVHNGFLVAPCTMKRQRHRLCVFLVHGDMNEDHARPPPTPLHATHKHTRARARPQRVPGGAVHCEAAAPSALRLPRPWRHE